MECIFCKIVKKEAQATIIYEDDAVIAFDDIHPKAPFHKLIVPKKHIATLNDVAKDEENLIGHLMIVAKKIAKQLGIAEEGYRVLMNVNRGGGQVIFHIHLHLLGGRIQGLPG